MSFKYVSEEFQGLTMIELDKKYVFHIPLFKYTNEKLVAIEMDDILNDLLDKFSKNGYNSAYMTNVKAFYKSRSFDEVLITIFTTKINSESPEDIFSKWFKDNNTALCQEAFAYECGDKMFIEKL